jgi:hypothetical protein
MPTPPPSRLRFWISILLLWCMVASPALLLAAEAHEAASHEQSSEAEEPSPGSATDEAGWLEFVHLGFCCGHPVAALPSLPTFVGAQLHAQGFAPVSTRVANAPPARLLRPPISA